ncbi:MAG: hypothetical protein ACYC4U_04020 [Pirellulaceae bacterium]
MVCRIFGMCCLTLLVPGAVWAQTTPIPRTLEQLTKDVQDLQQKLITTSGNLTKLSEQVAKNTETITQNSQGIERLTTIINEELRKQQNILERIDELTQQQQDQLARQQAILDAIAQKDTAGRDVLRLSANMEQSEEFREDVRKAVHHSLDTQGELTVHNRMPNPQQIIVNLKTFGLGPDEMLTLKVPVGTVTAQLPGQPLTNWTVGAPTYRQTIEIVPETSPNTTSVFRPLVGGPMAPLATLPANPVPLTPLPPVVLPPVEYYSWP